MKKAALVFVWPQHIDFPLFRYRIKQWEKYFPIVYIAYSDHHVKENYRDFIREYLYFSTPITIQNFSPDWRDAAIKSVLDISQYNSQFDHYLFMEEDFLIKDESFWEKVLSFNHPWINYTEGNRMHPAFSLIDRVLVENSQRNFSSYPEKGLDHFGLFFQQLSQHHAMYDLDFLVKRNVDYKHMGGMTQNFSNFHHKQPFYKPDEFLSYVYLTNHSSLPMPDGFRDIVCQIEKEYGTGSDKLGLQSFFL